MRKIEAYAEEYSERVAIKIENGLQEALAIAQARQEVIDYAKKAGATKNDIDDLMKLIREQNHLLTKKQ